MSDSLADLASWLSPEFLAAGHHKHLNPTNKINPNALCFPPYEFASASSTESESDDDELAVLTRRFTRSAFLLEPRRIPYSLQKQRGFSGSPQSTLNWAATPPFGAAEEDAWDLIYAAAGEIARMKMRLGNDGNTVSGKNHRGLLGTPRAPQHHPDCSIWGLSEREQLLLRHQQRVAATAAASVGGGGRPPSLARSAWPTPQLQTPRYPHQHQPVVVGASIGGGGGAPAVKRQRAGTGVFLPRRYNNNPPEPAKKPACSPANLPAKVVQSSNKNMDPITAQSQAQMNGGFEMLMARRNALVLAQHGRRSPKVASTVAHPEVLLPQEWTY